MPVNRVICCDGTGNQYGKTNTNVVKLLELLEDTGDQTVFYDPGVGTSSSALLVPVQRLSQLASRALGLDLHRNVEEAYHHLMKEYEPGDRVFLFGFSRGAHTVRRLASMLEKCGLLLKGRDNMIPSATRMYNHESDPEVLAGFRRVFSRPCPVYFIGVWDTVSALSSLAPRPALDGLLSKEVVYAYHAVSIDEQRLQFPPNLWKEEEAAAGQTIDQVWFAGVHTDVGGSYEEQGLSDLALGWMLAKAELAGLRLRHDWSESLRPNPLAKQHQSWWGYWWFVPTHLYIAMLVAVAWVIQYLSEYLGAGLQPFDALTKLALENWPAALVVFLLLIVTTRRRRALPRRSKLHWSVRERLASGDYKPRGLCVERDGHVFTDPNDG